ncbi:M20/M25/M40 family metallo-hydrolase [Sphingomonas sp.]|uniref:M20/M25/M40 family metallo-hydrolase n=1 Tax=Sphingomonas sp. TaxID=28214 RepID=UPI00286D9418|nr:M20/M25/M40 family metallo-hydrolase [Sphingomonas sp.]
MRNPMLLIVLIVVGLLGAMAAKDWLVPLPSVRQVPAADEFNTHRAMARLTDLLGDERPHPADTAANDAVRERMLVHLRDMGLTPLVRDAVACNELHKARGLACARVRNVVVTIGPAAGKQLLLSAHYDSTPAGPGAGDAGAGVATLLEVAHLLKDKPLKRPVTILFNEGEELGLVGARAFLADPLSRDVDSLINLEGRGVTGPANMFETSMPNGAAVKMFGKAVDVPVANSLATDIYRLMPNYTDVNSFSERGWTTLNFAIIGNETRYHSAGDNLAALDQRSLQHMGDQTLALATALADGVPQASGNRIFMDLLGTELIQLPLVVGVVLLVALLAGFGWLAWHRGSLGRPLLAVVAALLLATALAWVAQMIVGLVRPGMFWRAMPLWSQLAAYASAIAATLGVLATLAKGIDAERLRTAFWLLFVAIGAAIALVAPGGIIFFLFPALVVLLGAFAGKNARGAERLAALGAVLLLFLTFGAMLALLEELLSRGPIWLLAPLGAVILLPALIEAKPLLDGVSPRRSLVGAAILALAGWGAAAAAPAYSADKQQQFSLEHVTDGARAWWSVTNDDAPLPAAFTPLGQWQRGELPYSERKRWLAAAPVTDALPAPAVQVVGRQGAGAGRRISLRLVPKGAVSVTLVAPEDADIRSAGTGSFVRPVGAGSKDGRYTLRCFGRSCEGLVMDVVIGSPRPIEFIVLGWRPGLPPAAGLLVRARPANARAQYTADSSLAMTRVRL